MFRSVIALMLLSACSSSSHDAHEPSAPEPTPTPTTRRAPQASAEFITTAELWAPDESAVLGLVIAMRETPNGDANDYTMPSADHDPGDGVAVLFGARLVREGNDIVSATTGETQTFELSMQALPSAVHVWSFDDATLVSIDRLETCTSCAPWRGEARYLIVVPEGQTLSATPQQGWTIAISP